ncbi:MAG: diacylglycerol kinase family protein, partial [Limnochordia bacterium]
MKDSKHRSVLESFEDALRGIAEALRSERNMRIHFCAALIVVGIGLLLVLNAVEM